MVFKLPVENVQWWDWQGAEGGGHGRQPSKTGFRFHGVAVG